MFSIKESIKYGWEKFKANLNLSLGSTLLVVVLSSLGEVFDEKDMGISSFVLVIALVVLSVIARIGYTKIFLRMADGEDPKFSEIFNSYKMFWTFLGVSILTGLAVLGGFILLIIPGIIWAIKYSFSTLILIDTDGRPIASMKESGAITKGSKWKLLGFYLVLGLINMAGVIALGVGLLVSIPVSMFATIHVYRELSKAKAGVSPNPAPTEIAPVQAV